MKMLNLQLDPKATLMHYILAYFRFILHVSASLWPVCENIVFGHNRE